jgi:acetyltransferase-like isoleucine patch superfamily enzyme
VEDGAFLGIGTVVKDKIKIGSWAVIGAGSLVMEDMPPKCTAYGSPARVRKY